MDCLEGQFFFLALTLVNHEVQSRIQIAGYFPRRCLAPSDQPGVRRSMIVLSVSLPIEPKRERESKKQDPGEFQLKQLGADSEYIYLELSAYRWDRD
jgi:hypothetical protein